jgi:hypothetical protein
VHAHGLIAKIPRTRCWRVTCGGRDVMGTWPCLREHHFPNVYRHRSGGLIFFARGKKLTAKESLCWLHRMPVIRQQVSCQYG